MTFTLQLLHASDLEGGVDAIERAPNFAAVMDAFDDAYANTLKLSAGDNYIPSPFFNAQDSEEFAGVLEAAYTRWVTEVLLTDPDNTPEEIAALEAMTVNLDPLSGAGDMAIMNIIGFDASALGNHEFDPGPDALAAIIDQAMNGDGEVTNIGALFPYLSSNLDFSDEDALAGLFTTDFLENWDFSPEPDDFGAATPAIAPSTFVDVNGERIAIIGATTQLLETISSTGDVDEITGGANNMSALAAVLQPQINAALADGDGDINKVIVVSHLQQIALETELAGLLTGVDIIVAGGSDTLLADDDDVLRDGDTAADTYPRIVDSADDKPVAIVSTDGEYSYVGRLVVEFDDDGVIIEESIDAAVSGAYATDEAGVLAATGAATLDEALDGTAENGSLLADIVEDITAPLFELAIVAKEETTFAEHSVFLDGERASVRTEETNLGNLTADANLAAAKAIDGNVLVSFKNGGGIRAAIAVEDGSPGEVSQLDIENTLRFDNKLAVTTLTLGGLLMILEHAVAATDSDAGATPGRFPQIGGLRFAFDEDEAAQVLRTNDDGDYIIDMDTNMPAVDTAGARVRDIWIETDAGEVQVLENGEFLVPENETFGIVTLNFLAAGGDGYPFPELAQSPVQLITIAGTLVDDALDSELLGEQAALANYLEDEFEGQVISDAETSPLLDQRIIQIAQLEGDDDFEAAETHVFDAFPDADVEGGSEVVVAEGRFVYSTNGAADRVDVFNAASGELERSIDLASTIQNYAGVQSIAVHEGMVAAAVAREDADVMLTGLEGTDAGDWTSQSLLTIGYAVPDGDGGEYLPTGVLDGIGAIALNDETVRIYVNSELGDADGYAYEVDGLTLTGARIHYFDIDKETMSITEGGLAIEAIIDQNGETPTDLSFVAARNADGDQGFGFNRFCSSVLVEHHQFGMGSGLHDDVYFTGEETGGNFSATGGAEWALDIQTGTLYAVPAFGRGAWENVTEIDTGTTSHVAFLLADDTSPFDADGDGVNEAAPLFLYVGEKDTSEGAGFLSRNGLEGGTLYVWVSETGTSPEDFAGTGATEAGTWVEIDNAQNLEEASVDGSTGYDAFGYPTQATLWTRAEALGAFQFSRPEDVAVNPEAGSEAVLASTGRQSDFNGADVVGALYKIGVDFDDIDAPVGQISIIYDGDDDDAQTLRSPDNLDWADDGYIYVQEDRAVGGIFGEGAVNESDAGVVRIDPETGEAIRIAEIDQTNVAPFDAVEENIAGSGAIDVGDWESSGILDVSELFDRDPGALFLADVQAHGLDDQDRFVTEGVAAQLTDDNLKEGGQLLFLGTADFTVENPIGETAQSRPGVVALYDENGDKVGEYEVGNLPDMVTFTPDGSKILVAGEGEPVSLEDDPLGTISVIDVASGEVTILDFTGFDDQKDALIEAGLMMDPRNPLSQDLEPEYIAVAPDGQSAWVSLQEANAFAVLDLSGDTPAITEIIPGFVSDRSLIQNVIDASNRDDAINLVNYDNLYGLAQPDAIAAHEIDGVTYYFTANEGDGRDYGFDGDADAEDGGLFNTEARVKDVVLDEEAFGGAEAVAALQENEVLGRLKIRTDIGDIDGDGDYDRLYHYGSRSFTIYAADGTVVWDSGAEFSRIVAEIRPELFNHDDGDFDDRSDDKGVEPEAIAVGEVEGETYAFIGLERDGGIMVYRVSDPTAPEFVKYIDSGADGHVSPETIAFISAEDSVDGVAQIAVAFEVSGESVLYTLNDLATTSEGEEVPVEDVDFAAADGVIAAGTPEEIAAAAGETGFADFGEDGFFFEGDTTSPFSFDPETGLVTFGLTTFTVSGQGAGNFLLARDAEGTRVQFVREIVEVSNGQAVDVDAINGIAFEDFLVGDGVTVFNVSIDSLNGSASFSNKIGVYEVDEAGDIVDIRIMFQDSKAVDAGDTFTVDGVAAGNSVGFFLVQDGATALGDVDEADLDFVFDGAGVPALQIDGEDAGVNTFHSFSADWNPDGVAHVLSGASDEDTLRVGFEDLTGWGDRDFEDFVFNVAREQVVFEV